jgi:hypothetical protein
LRRTGGKLVVTDGRYAETKEQLGGLSVLEARDMGEAVELMSKHPGVRLGGPFEIRPVDEPLTERCTSEAADSETRASGMKLACLGYGNEKNWNAVSQVQQEAMINQCIEYDQTLRTYGRWASGHALQSGAAAKTLRVEGRQVLVTDGPFAETKEQIGGVATYQFRDMDQAIEAWSEHPCLLVGDILELRPVDEEFEAQWEARQKRANASASR